MMTLRTMVLAISLSTLLAACGGGSGGGVASAPTPIAAPAPAPTPPWQPPVTSPVTPTETFTGLAITTTNQSDGNGDSAFTTASNQSPSMLAIGRDASGGYTITVPMLEISTLGINAIERRFDFPSASRNTNNASLAIGSYYVRQSQTSTAGYDHSLQIDTSASGFVNVATLYACNLPGGESCAQDPRNPWSRTYLVFGHATPLGEIPLSGTAGYSGSFGASNRFSDAELGGSIALQVDFASKGVTGLLSGITIFVDAGFNGQSSSVPDFALTGQLGPDGFLQGNMTPSTGSTFTNGSWQAGLFGPNAAAMGGTLLFNQPTGSGTPYAGAFTATKN